MSKAKTTPHIYLFMYILGVTFTVLGIWYFAAYFPLANGGIKTKATVVACGNINENGEIINMFKGLLYTLQFDGHESTIRVYHEDWCSLGKEVDIIYDKIHPQNAMLQNTPYLLASGILILCGLLILFVTWKLPRL